MVEEKNRQIQWPWRWLKKERPMSKKAFERMQKVKERVYEITIGFQGNPGEVVQKYLEKLGIPLKPEEGITQEYVFERLKDVSAVLNDLLSATGVPAETRLASINEFIFAESTPTENPILNSLITSSEADAQTNFFKNIQDKVTTRAKEELERVKQSLKQSQRESSRAVLERKKGELEEELAKKIKEEKAEEGRVLLNTATIKIELARFPFFTTDEKKKLGLISDDDGQQPELRNPEEFLEEWQRTLDEREIEIAGYSDEPTLRAEISELRKQLIEATRAQTVKDSEGNIITINPASPDAIAQITTPLGDKQTQLANLIRARQERERIKRQIAHLTTTLERELTIKGQTKRVKEWLEELRKEGKEGRDSESAERKIADIEKELAEVSVVLDYFSQEGLQRRMQRRAEAANFDDEDFDINRIFALNPKLRELFNPDNISDDQQLKALQNLYILFGEDFLYPLDPNSEKVRLIRIFLANHSNILIADKNELDKIIRNIELGLLEGNTLNDQRQSSTTRKPGKQGLQTQAQPPTDVGQSANNSS